MKKKYPLRRDTPKKESGFVRLFEEKGDCAEGRSLHFKKSRFFLLEGKEGKRSVEEGKEKRLDLSSVAELTGGSQKGKKERREKGHEGREGGRRYRIPIIADGVEKILPLPRRKEEKLRWEAITYSGSSL